MKTVLAFDPGEASGWFYGRFDDVTALRRLGTGIIQGGPQGLSDFLVDFLQDHESDHVVAEVFVPDGTPGGRETVSPRGEGVLIVHFGQNNVAWQKRSEKAWGYDSQEKSDQKLHELGLWVTGKDVRHTDGRDANDAALHAIQFMRKMRHRPTLTWIYGEAPAE